VGIIGGELGYRVLRRISIDGKTTYMDSSAYKGRSKLEAVLGPNIWEQIKGRTVIDFGCGQGNEVIEMAQRGAARVIGLDTQLDYLAMGRAASEEARVGGQCQFTTDTKEKAEVIVSIDAFEHFQDPADVLAHMHRLLVSGGRVFISFGPTWYHPLGGHLFSVFPWAHLIFTEQALIRWRSDFKTDGAKRFSEVAGGLNQMTIRRFERLVKESPFQFEAFECVPIRKFAPIAGRLTREWTTAIVRATMKSKHQ
jgi:SAM-dependent methyltransferase